MRVDVFVATKEEAPDQKARTYGEQLVVTTLGTFRHMQKSNQVDLNQLKCLIFDEATPEQEPRSHSGHDLRLDASAKPHPPGNERRYSSRTATPKLGRLHAA